MPNGTDKRARQEAIKRVINSRMVATQDELVRLMFAEGIEVTQATLSRDLAQLHATRVHRPEGGAFYEIYDTGEPAPERPRLRELVVDIGDNDALVVVRTMPGAAPAIALEIDDAKLPECLGTLAGADTIFITPQRGTTTRKLTHRLRELFGNGERP